MTAVVYLIRGGDYEGGGAASRSLKEQLKKIGAEPAVIRRAMVAAYEAEMNVVIHALRGELRATLENGLLDVEITDEGPGIADLEQALRPGFSTASAKARELGFGAGMGLPNIRKNSDTFTIESTVGRGTRIRFTIALKPQTLYGTGRHGVQVVPESCHECLRCLHVCPTRALRVFRKKPQVLDYLCVDCAACLAVCPTGALTLAGPTAELKPADDLTLVLPPATLVQFGPGVAPQRVLEVLAGLGFGDVVVTAAWEAALRAAAIDYAQHEAEVRPVIVPACAAVVNLIEARFPSLIPHLAPFVTALEAVRAELTGRRAAFVVTCPCQRTVLLADTAHGLTEIVLPATLRAAVLPRLHGDQRTGGTAPTRPEGAGGPPPSTDDEGVLEVSGIEHVVRVMEQIEDGLAGDVSVVEPYACQAGGFGSALLPEEPSLARHRWRAAHYTDARAGRARRRSTPFKARPGLRLDPDMGKAIQKLARIDKLTRGLPGDDCALCGAPTCAALAEDIVLGRAAPEACVRLARSPDGAGPGQPPKEKL